MPESGNAVSAPFKAHRAARLATMLVVACGRSSIFAPDLTPPETTLSSGPPKVTNARSATFVFSANEERSTFFCALDESQAVACTSPFTTGLLVDGTHTFSVWAIDPSANADPIPERYTWTIDTVPPETSIVSGPAPLVASNVAVFSFTSNETGSSFLCALDDAGAIPCASPFDAGALADGFHTMAVRAFDDAGNPDPTPAALAFTVDTAPPETTLILVPPVFSNGVTVSFDFSCSEGACSYICAVDDAGPAVCAQPFITSPLSSGPHTISVRAVDDAGNADPTPATFAWTIDSVPPTSTINTSGGFLPYGQLATLSGTAGDDFSGVARVEVSFDGGGDWVAAMGTTTWQTLFTATRFTHRIRHRAVDDAGNVESPDAGIIVYTSKIPAMGVLGQPDVDASCTGWPGATGMLQPIDVALDLAGHRLFVSDSNRRVLVFNLDVSNAIVDATADAVLGAPSLDSCGMWGSASATTFGFPTGLAFDAVGNRLFVADVDNSRVLVFSTATITNGMAANVVLGQPSMDENMFGTSATLMSYPRAVAIDSARNRLFVADTSNNRVLMFDSASVSNGVAASRVLGQTVFDAGWGDAGGAGVMRGPNGVAVDSVRDRLFVADSYNNRVLIFEFDGGAIQNGALATRVLGQSDMSGSDGGTSASRVFGPTGLTFDSAANRLFVADKSNGRVLVFDTGFVADGENAVGVLGQWDFFSSGSAVGPERLYNPSGVAIDETSTRLYVADSFNHRIVVFDVATVDAGENAVAELGHTSLDAGFVFDSLCANGPGRRSFVASAIAVDPIRHRLFVADSLSSRVLVFALDGSDRPISTSADFVLGKRDFSHCYSDGIDADRIQTPSGLAYDKTTSRLYVSDPTANRVLVFDTTNLASGMRAFGLLGQTSWDAGGPGMVSASTMSGPSGLAIDEVLQRLFVTDENFNRVLVFDVAAVDAGESAMMVIGQDDLDSSGGSIGGQDGLNRPTSIAYESSTSLLYVGDSSNARVLVFDLAFAFSGMPASFVLGQTNFQGSMTGQGAAGMTTPAGLSVDGTRRRLFVADQSNKRVLMFDTSRLQSGASATNLIGQSSWSGTQTGSGAQGLDNPRAIAVGGAGTTLFVGDGAMQPRILVFDIGP